MTILQMLFVSLHITAGFIGLVAFWVPVFTRKGGKNHKLYGKVFKYSAYTVLIAATIALLLRIPAFIETDFNNEVELLIFSFYMFLAYLIVVVFINLRHGLLVLEHKQDITELDTPFNNAMALGAMAASVALIAYAIAMSPANRILFYVLSPLGFFTCLEIKAAIHNKHHYKKVWLYEHLGALLGTGIAFHTAFAIFGASRLFDLNPSGFMQIIPWIAPTVIGIPAIQIWTRYYKQRYGDLVEAVPQHEP